MQKKVLITIGIILGMICLICMFVVLKDLVMPIVYTIGWIVLFVLIGAGLFFIVKNIIRLLNK